MHKTCKLHLLRCKLYKMLLLTMKLYGYVTCNITNNTEQVLIVIQLITYKYYNIHIVTVLKDILSHLIY